ncbi:hypothetical protein M9H77_12861 [Catharanthus roseus]|uniref:Uncharacterized protein n=1 Tax=Catharanthus roseus TaxID=4058 RepID=A0ACC0BIN8_CATRO|nr:hypothetical protein M9H77_12861 [Catharanthus roseus]
MTNWEKKNEEIVRNMGSNMISNTITTERGNGDIQNVVQDIEALRDRMDAPEAAVRTLELARGGVANVPVAANVQNQVAGYNSSDEEEDLILAEDQNRPSRRGGGRVERLPGGRGCYIDDRERVVKSVTEVKNLAIKAELMIRDRGGSRIEVKLHRDGIRVLNGRKIRGLEEGCRIKGGAKGSH